jgi:hypothetical protein
MLKYVSLSIITFIAIGNSCQIQMIINILFVNTIIHFITVTLQFSILYIR